MATKVIKRRLPDLLLEQGLVTEEQLKECIALQRATGQNLAHILVERKYLSEEDLVITLSEQLGIPHMRVANYNIPKNVLAEVPETLARQHTMLPISITGDVLTLAMSNPLNIMALDDLRMLTSYEIEPVVAIESELLAAIEKNYGGGKAHDLYDELLAANKEEKELEVVEENDQVEDVSALEAGAEDEPVKRLVRLILFNGLELGASDIHIEPFEKIVRVRYRVDGTLEEAKGPPKNLQSNLVARLKILSGNRIDETRKPQDGRIHIRYNNRDIDFRVAYLPSKYGEKVVLRVLDKSNLTLDLEGMGFEKQPMEAFNHALKLPHGMILMTGPTGSGKTTTLYSALNKLNVVSRNIVTVEDPIEYELFGITQVQTHAAIGLTFAEALRQILRQDPDIVMLGEIRDHETADVAVKAALTGHLVLSTLHTNDAAGVFPRLTDMGVEPFLVQSSVALAAAQRLLKRVCSYCKEPIHHVPKDVLERIQYKPNDEDGPPQFVRGRGCAKCKNTGYKGRVAVIEAMPNYPEIQDLVMNRASGTQIKLMAMKCGMRTLRMNALSKAAKGITTIEQVLEHTTAD
ncbi:MAG TPA: ATPase, T2SS/T4P/T4SS family [Candidatus Hydrogenedentes bacterium]|nr:ATPase, T2SS/T4P/T4SS family [Candidatus Hydrogenedentota bacterium]HRT20016.1 ATPase, T2SS/T4P/T4SS family [Candidatus Hydrogenedentota bacterium]HRT64694.1 ATPase, T2SS/T4P/T4SS family [Candidatus Hydrogenedentota bacterium]